MTTGDMHMTSPEVGAYTPSRRDLWRRRRERFLAWLLTDQTVGAESVPNSWASLEFAPKDKAWDGATHYSMRFVDDSFGVMAWKSWPDTPPEQESVCVNVRADVFRRMALWYLWRWAAGEWFGVRRWLFYKRLSRRVASWNRMGGIR